MKYLIIYTYTCIIDGFMGLESNPEVIVDGYRFLENIYDLQDFIKELEIDKDVLCVDQIVEIKDYEDIKDNFIKSDSKLRLK